MESLLKKYPIPQNLVARGAINQFQYEEKYADSTLNPEKFWAELARSRLFWDQDFTETLSFNFNKGEINWFNGGKLNISVNCLDRHLETLGNSPAIIWEGDEMGENRTLTYNELHTLVCKIANSLRTLGVKKGDRVAIYMPMIPESAAAMLACARIGAIHSVIFAGFSAEAIRDRVLDAKCSVIFTADEGIRGGKKIPLKATVDQAIDGLDFVKQVIVAERTDSDVPMNHTRDYFLSDLIQNVSSNCPPESMDSEDPLFILYTSGSTGKPKGVVHSTAGYLLYAGYTHEQVFDYRQGDIYCCAADIGWITGHTYIVYGPLSNGATTMMFESIPLYPDPGRYWSMVERHKINTFYTAPTAIRAIAKEGDSWVKKYDRSSLRILGSVGEPINQDAWLWYYNVVGEGQCAIVDTWWQTETGGILISPLPGATETKPGSATNPFFGITPEIIGSNGEVLSGNGVRGQLCISFPWPGQARTVYGDHARFVSTYFSQYPGKYFTGDAAIRDEDGYYWITGRVDDVLIVSGHRLGTAELESAIVQSGIVAEAAVVGVPHDIKGIGIYAFCVLKAGIVNSDDSQKIIKEAVRRVISPIASPDMIQIVPGLPKTRSGKIMRRILRKIATDEYDNIGDITTLAEPTVVESIIEGRKKILTKNNRY